jgi:hypothetical protein
MVSSAWALRAQLAMRRVNLGSSTAIYGGERLRVPALSLVFSTCH